MGPYLFAAGVIGGRALALVIRSIAFAEYPPSNLSHHNDDDDKCVCRRSERIRWLGGGTYAV